MIKRILIFSLSLLTMSGFAQQKKQTTPPKTTSTTKPATTTKPASTTKSTTNPSSAVNPFKNNSDSISYAVGLRIAQSLKAQGFDNINMTLFQKAMSDIKLNKSALLSDAAVTECISQFQQKANAGKDAAMQKENAGKAAIAKKEGATFLATNGKRSGVVTLPSGVQYEVMTNGTENKKPLVSSTVTFHYTGSLLNGTVFETSVGKDPIPTFPLGQLIKGWQDVMPLMNVGSKWKLFIPSDLAYGDNPRPGGAIGPGDTLIFEVELVSFKD